MKLFLIERIGDTDYDEFDGFVIAAPTEAEARAFADDEAAGNFARDRNVWNSFAASTAKVIGIAEDYIETGIVLSSFNAG